MTNLLVPTDFTAASLKLAAQAVKVLNRPANFVLFHAFEMPFYYQDLIRPERPVYHDLLNDAFRQACKQLKEQYPQLVNKIVFRAMQGNTNAVFKNFADANQIDFIVCPHNYVYRKIHTLSLNPQPFFKKSKIPLLQELVAAQHNVLLTVRQKKRQAFLRHNIKIG